MTTKSRVTRALELADAKQPLGTLDNDAHKLAKWLTVGERSRVALANVLLLLADEQEERLHPIARAQRPLVIIGPDRSGDAEPAHPAPMPPEDAEVAEWLDSNDGRLFTGAVPASPPGEGAPPLPVAHRVTLEVMRERDDLRCRLETLTAAAYPALGVLARNDPAQRMVAERLEGVLAGMPDEDCGECVLISAGCKRAAYAESERDEAQAELTRPKEENARLKNRLFEMQNASIDLAQQLRRRDAVVEAARKALNWIDIDYPGGHDARATLHAALSALDQPTQAEPVTASLGADETRAPCCWTCTPDFRLMLCCSVCGNKRCPRASNHRLDCTNSNEPGQAGSIYTAAPVLDVEPATPPESPVPAKAPREIRVGSIWRHTWGSPKGALGLRVVEAVNVHGLGHIKLEGISGTWSDNFRDEFEWVSDPEPPAERPIVVGSIWMFEGCPGGNPTPGLRAVDKLSSHTVHAVYVDDPASGTNWPPDAFRALHTWVSDPKETKA